MAALILASRSPLSCTPRLPPHGIARVEKLMAEADADSVLSFSGTASAMQFLAEAACTRSGGPLIGFMTSFVLPWSKTDSCQPSLKGPTKDT